MGALRGLFLTLARHGRLVLIAGLACGILFPDLAIIVRGVLPELVACTLGVAALRIGPSAARGSLADIGISLRLVAAYQLALPLTVAPVFLLWPIFGSVGAIALASGRLLLLIACSSAVAFVIRERFFPHPSAETLGVIDGVSALLLAVLVIGLMSATGPAIIGTPGLFGLTLGAAFAINFSLQLAVYGLSSGCGHQRSRVAWSIVAGNRNIALFLVALPAVITDPLLLFIGCYQIPMYLTPVLMKPLYSGHAETS